MLGVHCFVHLLRFARLCDWVSADYAAFVDAIKFSELAKSTRDSSFVELLTSAHCTIGPAYVK